MALFNFHSGQGGMLRCPWDLGIKDRMFLSTGLSWPNIWPILKMSWSNYLPVNIWLSLILHPFLNCLIKKKKKKNYNWIYTRLLVNECQINECQKRVKPTWHPKASVQQYWVPWCTYIPNKCHLVMIILDITFHSSNSLSSTTVFLAILFIKK